VVSLIPACSAEYDEPVSEDEGRVVSPVLHLSVSDMTMKAVSRASEPMSPDIEKYVKTIAIFEFDNEGIHINGPHTYHFIDFIEGTVDGESGVGVVEKTEYGIVETELRGLQFEGYTDGKVCLVANVTEAQVGEFYDEYREPGQSYGRMTFDKFKEWSLPFEYKKAPEGVVYDETVSGHLETMYMFGYYQGPVDASNPEGISVDLGRLASRIDITIINDTGSDIIKRFGYHFDNVCHSAYFFPIKMSRPPTLGPGLSRTVICSGSEELIDGVPLTFPAGGEHTRYFYVAAHSAAGPDEATKLHLFHGAPILDGDKPGVGGTDIQISLGNLPPSEAAGVINGYSLSRNTRYHFTVRLKKKGSQAHSRSGAFCEDNGEIIVYLP